MHPARIAALLEPFLDEGCPASRAVRDVGSPDAGAREPRPQPMAGTLSPSQLDQISTYIDLLLRWNARINLTAIRDPEQIVPRHFGESFFLARHLFPEPGVESDRSKLQAQSSKLVHVLDLGSGAGFPALPIKIWAPHIHLTLIESNHRKAAFLREVARTLTLTNIDVIAERAESLLARLPKAHPIGRPHSKADEPAPKVAFSLADAVTFRAVERFGQILPVAATFLAPNARLALLMSAPQLEELKSIPSMTWQSIHVPQSHSRLLVMGTTNPTNT